MITQEKRLTEYNKFKHEEAASRKSDIFDVAYQNIGNLSKRDLKLIGIALYWAEGYKTDLANQFTKAYIKTSPSSKGKSGNRHPCGVCHVRIASTDLLVKIKGWVEGLKALSSSLA